MSQIKFSVKHGTTTEEACKHLGRAVDEVQAKHGTLVRRVDWSPARDAVTLAGSGFSVDLRVDASDVHVSGEIPLLGGLLGGPIAANLKQIVQQHFRGLPG